MTAKKKTPAKKAKSQKERFIEFAKSVGADDEAALGKVFPKAVPPSVPSKSRPKDRR